MKGPSPFSTDQYAPLLCLWGIKSLKHKAGFFFLHKDPNNGSSSLRLSWFRLYTRVNFALLVGRVGFLMKQEIWILNVKKCLQEVNKCS